MAWQMAIPAIASVFSGFMGSKSSKRAAQAQEQMSMAQIQAQKESEEARIWLLLAGSAVERGEVLSKREQQRFYLLNRLYGGSHE